MRDLPPLNSLKAFESVARLGGVVQAAQELCVSHGAVSKQVLNLERWVKVPLFNRTSRRLVLTPSGKLLLDEVTGALDRIAIAIDRIVPPAAQRSLVVSAPPTLTLHWLVPRLTGFLRQYPDIRIQLNNRRDHDNGLPAGVDVAIRRGQSNNPRLAETIFMDEAVTPVCAPGLARLGNPNSIASLAQYTWLMADMRPDDWRQWLVFAGLPELQSAASLSFDHTYLALEAALDGLGVAMGPRNLMHDEIEAGRLELMFPDVAAPSAAYFFVHERRRENEEAIVAFRSWLQDEGQIHQSRAFQARR